MNRAESMRKERIQRIVETLRAQDLGVSSIRELAGRLAVSEMTIRRDLEELARQNVVRLVHAGAVLVSPETAPPRYALAEAGSRMAEEKRRIGRRAAALIQPHDVVIVDSGSTTERLVQAIPDGLPLTLICFSLNVLVAAHRNKECRIVFAGGVLHENTLMFESPEGAQLIRRFRANKAFLSASGVSDRLGVTCANSYEVETKKAAIASSLERILVADSSKLGRIHPSHFAELRDFSALVTDAGLSPENAELLRASGIQLLIAE
jgi:DeoR family deoxyribose operon repressor